MSFPFNAYLLAFLGAFVTTFAAVPLWRKWCWRVGLVDDPGERKIHDKPIPLAGGLAVMSGMLVPLLAGLLTVQIKLISAGSVEPLTHGLGRRGLQLGAILFGALGMLILGWLDDKHELKPAPKFLGQLLIAALVAAADMRITLFVHSVAFSYAVTILWILTVTNAFNFMDNMNGLCAGLGMIASACFALLAAAHGQYLVALLALLTCGALLGFLPFNFPKASAFLGDSGSHLTGFLLAVLAILPHFYTPQTPDVLAVFSPLLILAVPLGDLAWVVALRTRMGRPFYHGDTNHLSHRLARRGLSQTRTVLVIWLLAAALGAAAFAL
ncbi:MAG: undecaprenyl/decaprenyl-phosphate alpha-N-acetylglucosaminyl 1-phosphate transferase [Verrucomicrobia bacterium]|nr:undecaprenyl/decaprenyl-phosphate alpha-N-acetylglucosaminyl 1-phosphate transferase [Verrucomicrobiota bacterium]